ncbi:MAG: cell division protein FtsL [Thermovirgaceae bacterium]
MGEGKNHEIEDPTPGIFGVLAFAVIFLAALWFGAASAEAWTYEELVETYGQKAELQPEAEALGRKLLSEAGDLEGVALWRAVVDPATPARRRAAAGLKLVREVFPGGDPARWNDVSGFWHPAMVPKPLAAFDAVYYTAIGLLGLEEPGAPWLARQLLVELKKSSRAAHVALREAPAEYEILLLRLDEATGLVPTGGWPRGKTTGKLPFARPIRSYVGAEYALMQGMTFLNGSGVPVSGMGPFAWDRKRGAIYRVIVEEDFFRLWRR